LAFVGDAGGPPLGLLSGHPFRGERIVGRRELLSLFVSAVAIAVSQLPQTEATSPFVVPARRDHSSRSLPAHDNHETALKKRDLVHVDGNEQRLFHKLVVTFVRVHSTLGRHNDPAYVTEVRGIVQAGGAAENIHCVVVPAQ